MIANRVKGIDDELYLYWYREDSAMSYDGKQVFWIKEFSQMMENIKKIYMETDFPRKGFRSIFIMAMDNQYKKRMDRSQFKPFVKQVENRKFLIKETIDVILHPRDFIQIYGNPEAKRKWKDHLYILKYLFFLRTRGI